MNKKERAEWEKKYEKYQIKGRLSFNLFEKSTGEAIISVHDELDEITASVTLTVPQIEEIISCLRTKHGLGTKTFPELDKPHGKLVLSFGCGSSWEVHDYKDDEHLCFDPNQPYKVECGDISFKETLAIRRWLERFVKTFEQTARLEKAIEDMYEKIQQDEATLRKLLAAAAKEYGGKDAGLRFVFDDVGIRRRIKNG